MYFSAWSAGCVGFAAGAQAQATFHNDVEPRLQAHCQQCHQPGEIGQMSLLSYDDVRPWARAIKAAQTGDFRAGARGLGQRLPSE